MSALPMQRNLHSRALSGSIGSEIFGLDLSRTLDDQTIAAIRGLWLERHVVFFRDQTLDSTQLKTIASRFGRLESQPYIKTRYGHPEIIEVVKTTEDSGLRSFGNSWHTDLSFQPCPPMATILYAEKCPEAGGDTQFVDMTAAYQGLSKGLQRILADMQAVHTGETFYGSKGQFYDPRDNGRSYSHMEIFQTPQADGESVHPVVRTHPENGRKALFVNPGYTSRFENMTLAESRPLLSYLFEFVRQPEFVCRFRWRPGSVAFRDNRVTQHYAIDDYDGHERRMARVTLLGDKPY